MILKSDQIATLLKTETKDPLILTPQPNIDEMEKSGAASVDLRLGTWFLSLKQSRMNCLQVSRAAKSSAYSQFTKMHYVPFGKEYYLHPRAFVLGITLEWIRLPSNIAGYVIGRSTWGRRGLIIATATGVHPAFTGCLTLELTNVGEIPIEIKPGMSICQLFLHKVDQRIDAVDNVDNSAFIGQRRPEVGELTLDPIALSLEIQEDLVKEELPSDDSA